MLSYKYDSHAVLKLILKLYNFILVSKRSDAKLLYPLFYAFNISKMHIATLYYQVLKL